MEIDYRLCTEIMCEKIINFLSSHNLLSSVNKENDTYSISFKNIQKEKMNLHENEFISINSKKNKIEISLINGMKLQLQDYASSLYHFTEEIINMGC